MRNVLRFCVLAVLSGSVYSESLTGAVSALVDGGVAAAKESRLLLPSSPPALGPVAGSALSNVVRDGVSQPPQVLAALVDEHGRQTVGVDDEDLQELVEGAGALQSCRLVAPGQSLTLDFSSDVPVHSLSQVQAFLVRCKRGATFRFGLFHKDVEVARAPISMALPGSGATTTSYLRFLTESGVPIQRARFHSDGDVTAISLTALLSAAGESLVGRIDEAAGVELRLLVE